MKALSDFGSRSQDLSRPGAGALAASLVLALLLVLPGCAEPVRQVISRPVIDAPVSVDTIFGEATLGEGRSAEAIGQLAAPQTPNGPLTLDQCLEIARKVSPAIDSADQGYAGAVWSRWKAITDFLPTASTRYAVTHTGDPNPATYGHDSWSWGVTVSQPIFTGGLNTAKYLLSQLGIAAADIQKIQAREDLKLGVKQAYYGILASEKALAVAKTSVVNLSSHLNVARNFFEVGMVPQNQVLQAEVELAKDQQEETTQERNLIVNKARLNILLRRPVDSPISVKDELRQDRFPLTMG
jgi:outer membrane protein TolC